jgi:hypothetical protein
MKGFPHASRFMKDYDGLTEVLTDRRLASLGDAYVNFVCSLALSITRGQPSGKKVKGAVLAEALRKAELREHMPSRMTSHKLADAAEALIVYAWLSNCVTLEESVATLQKTGELSDGFARLLRKAKESVRFS